MTSSGGGATEASDVYSLGQTIAHVVPDEQRGADLADLVSQAPQLLLEQASGLHPPEPSLGPLPES